MSSAGDDLDWKQVEWPANCGKCRQPFDCLVDNHLSLCGGCQKQFADCDSCDMRYDHSNGGNPTRCAACIQRQFGACTSCMVQFDRLADRHRTRCGVCQILFGTKNEGPEGPEQSQLRALQALHALLPAEQEEQRHPLHGVLQQGGRQGQGPLRACQPAARSQGRRGPQECARRPAAASSGTGFLGRFGVESHDDFPASGLSRVWHHVIGFGAFW